MAMNRVQFQAGLSLPAFLKRYRKLPRQVDISEVELPATC